MKNTLSAQAQHHQNGYTRSRLLKDDQAVQSRKQNEDDSPPRSRHARSMPNITTFGITDSGRNILSPQQKIVLAVLLCILVCIAAFAWLKFLFQNIEVKIKDPVPQRIPRRLFCRNLKYSYCADVSWIIDVSQPYEWGDHERVLQFISDVSRRLKYGNYQVKMSAITFSNVIQEVRLDESNTYIEWLQNLQNVIPMQFGRKGKVKNLIRYLLSSASSLGGQGHGRRYGVPRIAFFMTDGYFRGLKGHPSLLKILANQIQEYGIDFVVILTGVGGRKPNNITLRELVSSRDIYNIWDADHVEKVAEYIKDTSSCDVWYKLNHITICPEPQPRYYGFSNAGHKRGIVTSPRRKANLQHISSLSRDPGGIKAINRGLGRPFRPTYPGKATEVSSLGHSFGGKNSLPDGRYAVASMKRGPTLQQNMKAGPIPATHNRIFDRGPPPHKVRTTKILTGMGNKNPNERGKLPGKLGNENVLPRGTTVRDDLYPVRISYGKESPYSNSVSGGLIRTGQSWIGPNQDTGLGSRAQEVVAGNRVQDDGWIGTGQSGALAVRNHDGHVVGYHDRGMGGVEPNINYRGAARVVGTQTNNLPANTHQRFAVDGAGHIVAKPRWPQNAGMVTRRASSVNTTVQPKEGSSTPTATAAKETKDKASQHHYSTQAYILKLPRMPHDIHVTSSATRPRDGSILHHVSKRLAEFVKRANGIIGIRSTDHRTGVQSGSSQSFTAWSEWTKCTVSCGGGIQARKRDCTYRHYLIMEDCEVEDEKRNEFRRCNTVPCHNQQELKNALTNIVHDVKQGDIRHPPKNLTGEVVKKYERGRKSDDRSGVHHRLLLKPRKRISADTPPAYVFRKKTIHNRNDDDEDDDNGDDDNQGLHLYIPKDAEWTWWTRWSNCSSECGNGAQKRERTCKNRMGDISRRCPGMPVVMRLCVGAAGPCNKQTSIRLAEVRKLPGKRRKLSERRHLVAVVVIILVLLNVILVALLVWKLRRVTLERLQYEVKYRRGLDEDFGY